MSTVEMARAFCIGAHCAVGQKRKYTGEDYFWHPSEVAYLVGRYASGSTGSVKTMMIAAWLHDVVEDTQVTLEHVEQVFGVEVADLVEQLTDVSRPEDGNRAARKAIDRAHTAKASPMAKTIKLADLISNTRSIAEHDPEFAKVYLAEKRELLKVLTEGDPALYKMANDLLRAVEVVQ